MGENSKIEWCDHTFNPVIGCQKVGPGCDNCYAEGWAKRSGLVQWGEHAERRMTSEATWKRPLKWNRDALPTFGRPARVFCASLSDWADNRWPDGVRDRLFRLIRATPNLTWLLLTKRIGNVAGMLPADWGTGYPNVCLMITVVNQEEADRDIPRLLAISARWRGLSMEPLLQRVSFRWAKWDDWTDGNGERRPIVNHLDGIQGLNWVIVGGESGPHAREMDTAWARSIRDECAEANVPFFMKQMTKKAPIPDDLLVRQFPFEAAAAKAA